MLGLGKLDYVGKSGAAVQKDRQVYCSVAGNVAIRSPNNPRDSCYISARHLPLFSYLKRHTHSIIIFEAGIVHLYDISIDNYLAKTTVSL